MVKGVCLFDGGQPPRRLSTLMPPLAELFWGKITRARGAAERRRVRASSLRLGSRVWSKRTEETILLRHARLPPDRDSKRKRVNLSRASARMVSWILKTNDDRKSIPSRRRVSARSTSSREGRDHPGARHRSGVAPKGKTKVKATCAALASRPAKRLRLSTPIPESRANWIQHLGRKTIRPIYTGTPDRGAR